MKSDFTNEGEFPIADAGVQELTVDKVYAKDSKNGRPMIVFEFLATNNARLFYYCMNEPTIRWGLKSTLETITGQKQPHGPVEFFEDDLKGKKVKAEIFHDEWNGQVRSKIKNLISNEVSPGQTEIEEATDINEELEGDLPF